MDTKKNDDKPNESKTYKRFINFRQRNKRKVKLTNGINNENATVAAAILTPNANRRTAGSNWNNALHQTGHGAKHNENQQHENQHNHRRQSNPKLLRPEDKYVAMDCEMVGIGYMARDDMLARVSIVNKVGEILIDKYVKPVEIITDYRTSVSGIRPQDLITGHDFDEVQQEVKNILENRILVGHNVKKDLQVLHMTHPYSEIRDTSNYKPLSKFVSHGHTPSLKHLSAKILGEDIQTGEHSSVEDARATMNIYNKLSSEWEEYVHLKNKRKRQ